MRYEGGLARRLYDHYGSATAVFKQPLAELVRHKGFRRSIAENMNNPGLMKMAQRELQWMEKRKINTVFLYDDSYPVRLRECPDAPLLLYVTGPADLNRGPFLSVVGTRSATPYGKAVCRDIIGGFKNLGINPVIISGLAFGIDITAHLAAMENNLTTLAVLPAGLDQIYPATHLNTAMEISRRGALVTEFPSETQGNRHNFLQRNRIIAGLSDATLVIESKKDGGALITAHLACDYSRDVLAVPGRPCDICSKGCNDLIKNNKAALVASAYDIARTMLWKTVPEHTNAYQQDLFAALDNPEKLVYSQIKKQGGDVNSLSECLQLSFPVLSATLTKLQVKGLIECMENNEYKIKS
ncbi:MAG TPA: DNA-processing protein DprA [Bacteroidales bacterium]|nr:DNA-processing protein DprA [Bacteroidales bacterium]HRW94763.1 DNA-processing protein DprA [Bacteroidales bacterium]